MKTYGSVWRSADGNWVIKGEPHVMIRFKRLFGKVVHTTGGASVLSDTPENALELEWFLRRYPMDNPADDYLERRAAQHRALGAEVTNILSGNYVPRDFPLEKPLREYQKIAAEMALKTGRLLIGDDVGLGKSATSIGVLSDPAARPALVVTLTHLPKQWQEEIRKFLPGASTHILKKGTPYPIHPLPDVIISNYHKLSGWQTALAGKVKTVVFDECQELRKTDSNKYHAAAAIASRAAIRVGASATPVYNYGGEIHAICDVLAPGELGEWNEFSREWTNGGERDKASVKDPVALGTYLRDQGIMLRRTRKEVGRELPPLTTVPHMIEADLDEIEKMTGSVVELARLIVKQGGAGFDKMRAAEEFSWRLRQATGIAKAPFVADFVRMLVEGGENVVLYGWHLECFGRGERVMLADGRTKAVEEVQVGDALMGPDSRPRMVSKLHRGYGRLYRIVPRKGDSWVCSENHVLSLCTKAKNRTPVVNIPLSSYLRRTPRARRDLTLYRSPLIEFGGPPVREPWLMGYWLGDGNSHLQTLVISTADSEVVSEAERIASRHGLRLTSTKSKGTCRFYRFAGPIGHKGKNPLLNHFNGCGLHRNKHIPAEYLRAPAADRRELLAGLIDSDGYMCRGNSAGTAAIASTLPLLAADIVSLARSLGLAAYMIPRAARSGGSPYWDVSISGDLTSIPTRIARKRPIVRRNRKNVLNVGFTVEPAGTGDYFGFEVEGPDRLFLLSDFTVVHNCYRIWAEKLRDLNPMFFTGEQSQVQKEHAKEEFISGRSKVLVMSLRAGAGLDGLQGHCKTVVFGELDWSPSVHVQAIGRVHRDGQADPVFAYYLIANSGSDPVVSDVLGVKRGQSEGIINPNAAVIEKSQSDPDRMKKLAADFLRQRGAPTQLQIAGAA